MTIRELKALLDFYEDDKEVFIALFKNDNTADTFDIESISDNNGHMQINIEEVQ